jgi:hypothetical protein
VEANLLDGIGDVGAGERQVLEGPSKAPEVSRISNRSPGLDEYLNMCVHRCRNWLVVHHASSLKNIESKLMLSEEESVHLMVYGDSKKIMEESEVLHGELPLEGRYGLLHMCCARCGEDNVINVKQQVCHICVAPKDK